MASIAPQSSHPGLRAKGSERQDELIRFVSDHKSKQMGAIQADLSKIFPSDVSINVQSPTHLIVTFGSESLDFEFSTSSQQLVKARLFSGSLSSPTSGSPSSPTSSASGQSFSSTDSLIPFGANSVASLSSSRLFTNNDVVVDVTGSDTVAYVEKDNQQVVVERISSNGFIEIGKFSVEGTERRLLEGVRKQRPGTDYAKGTFDKNGMLDGHGERRVGSLLEVGTFKHGVLREDGEKYLFTKSGDKFLIEQGNFDKNGSLDGTGRQLIGDVLYTGVFKHGKLIQFISRLNPDGLTESGELDHQWKTTKLKKAEDLNQFPLSTGTKRYHRPVQFEGTNSSLNHYTVTGTFSEGHVHGSGGEITYTDDRGNSFTLKGSFHFGAHTSGSMIEVRKDGSKVEERANHLESESFVDGQLKSGKRVTITPEGTRTVYRVKNFIATPV